MWKICLPPLIKARRPQLVPEQPSGSVVLATVLCYGTVHVLILALAQGEPNHIIVTRVVELLREIATFVVKDSVSDNLM